MRNFDCARSSIHSSGERWPSHCTLSWRKAAVVAVESSLTVRATAVSSLSLPSKCLASLPHITPTRYDILIAYLQPKHCAFIYTRMHTFIIRTWSN